MPFRRIPWFISITALVAAAMLVAGMWWAASGVYSGELNGPAQRVVAEVTEIGPPKERRRAFRPPTLWVRIGDREHEVVAAEDRVYSQVRVGSKVQVDYKRGRSGRVYILKVDLPGRLK